MMREGGLSTELLMVAVYQSHDLDYHHDRTNPLRLPAPRQEMVEWTENVLGVTEGQSHAR